MIPSIYKVSLDWALCLQGFCFECILNTFKNIKVTIKLKKRQVFYFVL